MEKSITSLKNKLAEETAANKSENRKNLRDNMELIHEIKELRMKIGH